MNIIIPVSIGLACLGSLKIWKLREQETLKLSYRMIDGFRISFPVIYFAGCLEEGMMWEWRLLGSYENFVYNFLPPAVTVMSVLYGLGLKFEKLPDGRLSSGWAASFVLLSGIVLVHLVFGI